MIGMNARSLVLGTVLFLAMTPLALAQSDNADDSGPQALISGAAPSNQVVVTGVVPDQATKSAVLDQLRSLYGEDRVIDEVTIGSVVAPPHWDMYLKRMLVPRLTKVSRGKLTINGNHSELDGSVANESLRQSVVSDMAKQLNPSYSIQNNLEVSSSKQVVLDKALANRTITFESASAKLTSEGRKIVNQMVPALQKVGGQTVEIIGHTDNSGSRSGNLALSKHRAQAVKDALVDQGIKASSLVTLGVGEQRPVASNETPEGRARNRRIEFRIQGKAGQDP